MTSSNRCKVFRGENTAFGGDGKFDSFCIQVKQMTQEKRFENYDVKVYDLNSRYSFLRCYREVKAEARMKLCQTEMVEVDLLRKQFLGGIPARMPERLVRS